MIPIVTRETVHLMQDLKVILRFDAKTGKVKAEIEGLEKELKDVGVQGKKAGEETAKGFKKAEEQADAATEVVKGMRDELKRLVTIGFAVKFTKDIIRTADEMKLLDARIQLVSDSQKEFNIAQDETVRIALETHTSLATTVDLYTRLQRSLTDNQTAQSDVLNITQAVAEALAVGGATAAETSSVILQLGQGLASGAVRGQEFNAVAEGGSRIMQALKDDLGKTTGELREMAFAGELTTEIVTGALLRQSEVISTEFAQIPVTVDKAFTDLRTNFSLYVKDVDQSIGATDKLSSAIVFFAENIETIIDTIIHATTAIALYKGLNGVQGLILSYSRATAATAVFSAATGAATLKVGVMATATRGLNTILKANPIGLLITAGFLAYEGANAILDSHNEKLEELSKQSKEAADAISSIDIELSKGFDADFSKVEQSIQDLNQELNSLAVNYARTQAELLNQINSGDASGIGFDVLTNLVSGDGFNTSEQLGYEAKRKEIEETKLLAQANKFLTDSFGPLIAAAKELTDAEESASAALISDRTAIEDWIESTEKQIEKTARKNEIFGLTAVQVARLDAENKKALTTDLKLIASIDKTTESLIKELEQNEANLEIKKEKAELQKLENSLINEYGTEAEKIALLEEKLLENLEKFPTLKALLNKEYKAEKDLILGVADAAKKLQKEQEAMMKLDKDEAELIQQGYDNYIRFLDNLDFERELLNKTTFERELSILSRELEAQGIHATSDELKELLKLRGIEQGFSKTDSFESLLNNGKTFADILKQAGEGFSSGLEGGVRSMDIIAQGAQFLMDVWDSTAGKDDAGRVLTSLNEVASTGALGPIAQAVSQVVSTIDALTGGRLLGTSYEVQSSAINLSTANGGSGSTTLTETRERSFFRGTQTRETIDALTGQALAAIRAMFEEMELLAYQTATAIGGTVVGVIGASFNQEFDADGNVTLSESIIDGVGTYNDATEQEFKLRSFGEQIIAGLVDVTNGIVSALAAPFRDEGAAAVLEFAQFALLAVSDIENGNELLKNLTSNLDLIQDLQVPGESLSETYQKAKDSIAVYEDAIEALGIETDKTREQLIRSSVAMADFAGGVQELDNLWSSFFENFYTPAELTDRSIQASTDLLNEQGSEIGVRSDISQEDFRILFEAQLQAGNLTEQQTVQWLQFAQTLANVNNLIEEATAIENQRIATLNEYLNFSQSIQDEINAFNASDFTIAMNEIRLAESNRIATLNELAIAAGFAGASEKDLARAHQLTALQIDAAVSVLRDAIASLQDQLYGDDLENRIAELEALQTTGINNVNSAVNGLYDSWVRVIDQLRDYTRDRLVGDLSPLEADERLDQALINFYAAIEAARAGDLEAAQSLTGLANIVDVLNDAVNASGSDYNEIFFGIQEALDSVKIPDGIDDNIIEGNFTVVPSAELQALYDELEARNAASEASNRLALATQLAEHLAELSEAINQPLFEIADEIGLNMVALITDLGVNLDSLTAASVQNLANIANLLGVELSELADNLGEDVSIAMGELADAQSLLNDALENTIGDLPEQYTDLLAPLLEDVENAANMRQAEAALAALIAATSDLPIEYRNLLAPYFDDIDVTTQMDLQLSLGEDRNQWLQDIHQQGFEYARQTDVLIEIRDSLRGSTGGDPLVDDTGVINAALINTQIRQTSSGGFLTTVNSTQALEAKIQELTEINLALLAQAKKGNNLKNEMSESLGSIDDSNKAISKGQRKQTSTNVVLKKSVF